MGRLGQGLKIDRLVTWATDHLASMGQWVFFVCKSNISLGTDGVTGGNYRRY